MSDVKCPFCGEEFDICDTPADESLLHQYQCPKCNKTLMLQCSISVDWHAYCKDGEHDIEVKSHGSVIWDECKRCGCTENAREKEAPK